MNRGQFMLWLKKNGFCHVKVDVDGITARKGSSDDSGRRRVTIRSDILKSKVPVAFSLDLTRFYAEHFELEIVDDYPRAVYEFGAYRDLSKIDDDHGMVVDNVKKWPEVRNESFIPSFDKQDMRDMSRFVSDDPARTSLMNIKLVPGLGYAATNGHMMALLKLDRERKDEFYIAGEVASLYGQTANNMQVVCTTRDYKSEDEKPKTCRVYAMRWDAWGVSYWTETVATEDFPGVHAVIPKDLTVQVEMDRAELAPAIKWGKRGSNVQMIIFDGDTMRGYRNEGWRIPLTAGVRFPTLVAYNAEYLSMLPKEMQKLRFANIQKESPAVIMSDYWMVLLMPMDCD